MGKIIDLTGKRYNKLTVISRAKSRRQPSGKLVTYWNCKCDCGNITQVRGWDLKNGHIISCGCLKKTRNSLSKSRIYVAWHHMIQRCYRSNCKAYKNYGGRGIKICDEWLQDFMNFYNWAINNGYKDNLSIDRIDVNGNYEPNNCRWADDFTQRRNKRNNKYFSINGDTKTLTDWAKQYKIKPNVVRERITKGWNIEKALNTPVKIKYGHF